jgi:hypothetical protein
MSHGFAMEHQNIQSREDFEINLQRKGARRRKDAPAFVFGAPLR